MRKVLVSVLFVLIVIVTYSVPILMQEGVCAEKYEVFANGKNVGGGVYLYGDTYMYETSEYNEKIAMNFGNVIGVSAKYKGDYDDFNKLIKKYGIAITKSEIIDNVHIVYGISEKCGRCLVTDGNTVNIQVALNGNNITVGTPLIMGSY